MNYLFPIVFGLGLIFLVQRRLLHVDLSFFLFLALAGLSIASFNGSFIAATAQILGIIYPPIAIILLVLLVFLCLLIFFAVYLTRLRERSIRLARRLASLELHLATHKNQAVDSRDDKNPKE